MKSISIKLWCLMLALVFIALALIWCFQIVFLESFYFNIHERKLLREGKAIVEMIKADQPQLLVEKKFDELLLKYNARIDLYTPSRVIIYSSETPPKMLGIDKDAFLMEVLESNRNISAIKQNSMGNSLLLVGLPVAQGEVMTAVVIMTIPMASMAETVDTLKEQFIIISLILISVSAILSYIFSRYFTKPILEINKAAKTMAEGNLSIKVPVNTADELGVLSATINHLSTQLQKIEQLRKELIANVSHEFKTPLSLIKGYAETMRDVSSLSEEKRAKQLGIIIEESDRLNTMINEILDLSQMQSDYYNLDRSSFDIRQTIEAVANRLVYHIENKGIKLITEYASIGLVDADEKRIEQVIYNLMSNAIIHSSKEGKVYVRTKTKGHRIIVEIADEGEGISKEELPYIWDRFYKARESSGRHKGSGLGLAIVKSILEAHKGKYGVSSELGKGSSFWFELEVSA